MGQRMIRANKTKRKQQYSILADQKTKLMNGKKKERKKKCIFLVISQLPVRFKMQPVLTFLCPWLLY